MYKVAVIGDKESILGFSAIGIDIFPAYNEQEAKQIIHDLEAQNYGIIYITEKLSLLINDEIEKYRAKYIPAIITIPGNSGSLNIGTNKVKEYARKAIGVDIVFKDENETME
ncbi:MAG: V-type ATP synthase subunit F [Clostridia bacterium]|nr:V-type ATP synthase subunit F [Clostridia bacterium]